jgi:uncharacterized delta-60 repeat protein
MFATLWRSVTGTSARPRRVRPAVLALEDRTLLNAGAFDTTFGFRGGQTVSIHGSDRACGVVLQPVFNRIVVAGTSDGDFSLAFLTPDGHLVSGLGTRHNGTSTAGFGGLDVASGVAALPDGKIVVAGSTLRSGQEDFAVARFNADGTLDGTFGPNHDGKVTIDFAGGNDRANAVAVLPDGRIVLAGAANVGNFALARLAVTGGLDSTFGPAHNGKVVTDLGGTDFANAVAVLPDGRIVAAGFSNASATGDFAVARYNANGTLDGSFNPGGRIPGVVITDIDGGEDEARGVAVLPDGRIVAGGPAAFGGVAQGALVRYTATGALDPTFGQGGKVVGPAGSLAPINALALQPDGKILTAGETNTSPADGNFQVNRFTAAGALDPTFGNGGTAAGDMPNNEGWEHAFALALQPDGKILMAGYQRVGGTTTDEFIVARFEGDPPPPPRPPPPFPGPVDVTAWVSILVQPVRRHRGGPRPWRRVTLRNVSGQPLAGPLWLVLDGLPAKVRLLQSTGVTRSHGTAGSPYVAVPLPGNALAPGAGIRLLLRFANPRLRKVRFTPLLLEGNGTL